MKRKRACANKKLYDTTNIERELLKILLTNRMSLRTVITSTKVNWMTADSRWFFLEKIKTSFQERKTVVAKDTLIYEIEKEFEEELYKQEREEYKNELNEIYKVAPVEKAEFIIDKLKEADTAYELMKLLESSYETLDSGEVEEAISKIKSGSLSIVQSKERKKVMGLHRDAEEWFTEVIKRKEFPELYAGIKTGFKKFDDLTGGLFKGELTIIFGLSGKGKSTVLKNICSYVRKSGKNVLHVTNEENQWQVLTKYQSLESQIQSRKFKVGTIDDMEIEQWKAFSENAKKEEGEVYVLEISQYEDASVIEAGYYELVELGIEIDLICIDYLDLMAPIHKAYSENDEQAKITNDCKQLAIDIDKPVLSATQAGSHTEKLEKEDRPFLSAQDIYGTKRRTHSANTLIGIVNKTATVNVTERTLEERNRHKMVFCVPKNRDGPIFTFRQVMITDTGRIKEDPDDDDPWTTHMEEIGKSAIAESEQKEKEEEKGKAEVPHVAKKLENYEKMSQLEKEARQVSVKQKEKMSVADKFKKFLSKTGNE